MKLDKWRQNVEKELNKINDELGELCERVAKIEADMAWVKWLTMLIAGGVLAVLVRALLGG